MSQQIVDPEKMFLMSEHLFSCHRFYIIAKLGGSGCIDRGRNNCRARCKIKGGTSLVAFSIVDRLDIATVVLEVDVSVAVEIECKSSVDEEEIIQKQNLK